MAVLFRIGGQIGTRKMNPRALKPEVWEMTAKIARLRASILRKIGAEQDALAWEQRAIDCEEVV
jgi:hypothetical protein